MKNLTLCKGVVGILGWRSGVVLCAGGVSSSSLTRGSGSVGKYWREAVSGQVRGNKGECGSAGRQQTPLRHVRFSDAPK